MAEIKLRDEMILSRDIDFMKSVSEGQKQAKKSRELFHKVYFTGSKSFHPKMASAKIQEVILSIKPKKDLRDIKKLRVILKGIEEKWPAKI